jgi:IS605 OrfB family transposase
MSLHKEFNALKKSEFPWMYEVSKCAPQEALRNLEKASKRFFENCKKKQEPKESSSQTGKNARQNSHYQTKYHPSGNICYSETKPCTIVLEDLNVKGMMANKRMARAVGDVGMYEFKRQLTYKAEQEGSTILIASA